MVNFFFSLYKGPFVGYKTGAHFSSIHSPAMWSMAVIKVKTVIFCFVRDPLKPSIVGLSVLKVSGPPQWLPKLSEGPWSITASRWNSYKSSPNILLEDLMSPLTSQRKQYNPNAHSGILKTPNYAEFILPTVNVSLSCQLISQKWEKPTHYLFCLLFCLFSVDL